MSVGVTNCYSNVLMSATFFRLMLLDDGSIPVIRWGYGLVFCTRC